MSVIDEFSTANSYEILNETDKTSLIKIDYNSLIQHVKHWSYNREVIDVVVNDLYHSITDDNNIIWILTAIKERNSNELYLIDGQHRYEAIKRKITEDIDFKIEKFVYINIYNVNDINEDDEYIIEMHIGSTNENNVISPFGIHRDDYGGIDCQVNTFIIYFDVKCDGGEIAFYEEDDYSIKPYSLEGVYASKRCYKIINTNNQSSKTCKILMFEGELYHRVLKFSNGHRNLLSFQIKKY